MIDDTIHDRIQSVAGDLVGGTVGAFSDEFSDEFDTSTDGRVWDTQPENNNDTLPYVLFTRTGTDPALTLEGRSDLTNYTFTVESWAGDPVTARTVATAIYDGLHYWRDGEVLSAVMTNQSNQTDERGHVVQQEFQVAARE